ncbi:MAG: hypothetical protein OER95_20050, partial [Acidimicrobiia bacterium]|nr:hypothetical protein [Acidimicrobiia bacterium]
MEFSIAAFASTSASTSAVPPIVSDVPAVDHEERGAVPDPRSSAVPRRGRGWRDQVVPATLFVAVSVYALINHLRIPFYDNWSLAPLYGKLEDGTLTVGDLFQLHGSHWHASGYAVMLANAKLTGMA